MICLYNSSFPNSLSTKKHISFVKCSSFKKNQKAIKIDKNNWMTLYKDKKGISRIKTL